MPRKKVEAHAVTHNGKKCWRVIIPKELNGGKAKRRYFDNEDTAVLFAADTEAERGNAHVRFLALDTRVQTAVLFALDTLGERAYEIADAAKFYVAHNIKEKRTMIQAIAECVAAKRKAGKRKRSTDALENSLTRFAKDRESTLVSDITPKQCEDWINAPEAKSVDTRRSRQIDLGTFFSYCVKRGYCAKRPIDALEKLEHRKKSPKILTVEQCKAVMEAAQSTHQGDLLATIALQMFGGLRPYESYKVAWEMIKDGHLRLDETIAKTLDIRIVTINPTLKRWLAQARELARIRTGDKSTSTLPAWDAPRRMTDVRIASGVKPWPQDVLRHTFVSYHLEMFGWEKTVEQAGHSLAMSFKHYRALTTKAEAKKFWDLKP